MYINFLLKLLNEGSIEHLFKPINKNEFPGWFKLADGSYDVDGDVDYSMRGFKSLPHKFNKVTGNFDIFSNQFTSLEGCPKIVGGDFHCNNNKLISLEGCPEEVGGFFMCNGNPVVFTKAEIMSRCKVGKNIINMTREQERASLGL
jgi:hypothetical protein